MSLLNFIPWSAWLQSKRYVGLKQSTGSRRFAQSGILGKRTGNILIICAVVVCFVLAVSLKASANVNLGSALVVVAAPIQTGSFAELFVQIVAQSK